MKKILFLLLFAVTSALNTKAQVVAITPKPLHSCWYSTPSTQILKILYDNATHTNFPNIYVWLKSSTGTIYGPILQFNVTLDPLTGGWYYEYDVAANGVTLPTPLQNCYDITFHDIASYVDPLEWKRICMCDETACDATFLVATGNDYEVGVGPWSCNPGYTYTIDFGDGTPTFTMSAPFCVGVPHTYAMKGTYKICVTATNGINTCTKCKDVCINDMEDLYGQEGSQKNTSVNGKKSNHLNSKMNIYPVPAENQVKIDYEAQTSGKANISIINMKGNILKTMEKEVVAGKNSITFDITSLPSGLYIIKYTDNLVTISEQFSVIK